MQLENGVWLAGMALDPAVVYEAWCHQREYVCFIEEIGGQDVKAGEWQGAVHLVGYFDSIQEMEHTYDLYHGASGLRVTPEGWTLEKCQRHREEKYCLTLRKRTAQTLVRRIETLRCKVRVSCGHNML